MSFVLEFERGSARGEGLDNISGLFIWLLYLPILFFVILCCFFELRI